MEHPDADFILSGIPQKEWVVYALRNESDEIIYVGMSGSPRARIRQHLKEFGEHIDRVDFGEFDTRREALDAESTLIERLQPRLNLAGVPS